MAASDLDQDRIGLLNGGGADLPLGGEQGDEEGATMTLVEHLEELRRRLFICVIAIAVGSVVAFVFWDQILSFLLTPLPIVANSVFTKGHATKLIAKGIGEGFSVALKLSIAVGIAIAIPVVLYQLWAFIAPGLTRRERTYARPFTILGVGLFAIGLAVGFVVLRYPVEWLIQFGQDKFIYLIDADAYFSFVAYFLLAFGIVFELPLVLTFLSLVGIVSSQRLRSKRMYAWFGLWLVACFITPGADPYSPVIIGVAMTALYELSIVLMRILGK
jgi:sec-independent protein translocase protein TatC